MFSVWWEIHNLRRTNHTKSDWSNIEYTNENNSCHNSFKSSQGILAHLTKLGKDRKMEKWERKQLSNEKYKTKFPTHKHTCNLISSPKRTSNNPPPLKLCVEKILTFLWLKAYIKCIRIRTEKYKPLSI